MRHSLKLYLTTLYYLRPRQIIDRLWFKLYRPRIVQHPAPTLRPVLQPWIATPEKYPQINVAGKLEILNQTIDLNKPNVWDDPNLDRLTRYNLHYHDWLQHSATTKEQAELLMLRWIVENPGSQGSGWEPYCLSLRIVNWIKWLIQHPTDDKRILNSLTQQIHYLTRRLETHIRANHLLANAKALLFAGLFFLELHWYERGYQLWEQQLREQILNDGGHYERSPMYHALVLEDLLDVINILHVYQHTLPKLWLALVKPMLHWLSTMTHPDGELAFFNDTTSGVAPRLRDLCAYARRLNISFSPTDQSLVVLANSGYYRVKRQTINLIIDAAALGPDYQPGHGHADSLSFELALGSQRILVNRGISTYKDNALRHYQRSTAAHNTLTINDCNSSDVWKSFRVGRRARIIRSIHSINPDAIVITAAHNGYQPIIHERSWEISEQHIIITDHIIGKGLHKITQYFHIAPGLSINHLNHQCKIFCKHHPLITLLFDKQLHLHIADALHYPAFQKEIFAKTIVLCGKVMLPFAAVTQVWWAVL